MLGAASAASSSTGAVTSSVTGVVEVSLEFLCETTEQVGQVGQIVVTPLLQELLEPGPAGPAHPFDGPATGRGESDPRGSAVVGVSLTNDHPVALELLDLPGHRRGVDSQYLGEVGDPERVALCGEFEKQGGAGPVEPDSRQAQEPFVQADLGDRPGDSLQRLVEPVDWKGRRAGARRRSR